MGSAANVPRAKRPKPPEMSEKNVAPTTTVPHQPREASIPTPDPSDTASKKPRIPLSRSVPPPDALQVKKDLPPLESDDPVAPGMVAQPANAGALREGVIDRTPKKTSASETKFQQRQIGNLLTNFKQVDDLANGMLLEISKLRHQLKVTERERNAERNRAQELLIETESLKTRPNTIESELFRNERDTWRQKYENAIEAVKNMSGALSTLGIPMNSTGSDYFFVGHSAESFYAAAARSVVHQHLVDIDFRPDDVVAVYNKIGTTGVVERVISQNDRQIYTGWATTRLHITAPMLITVLDEAGGLGYSQPCYPRQDVASILLGSYENCGFEVTLIRPPERNVQVHLNVFPRDEVAFALKIPFLA